MGLDSFVIKTEEHNRQQNKLRFEEKTKQREKGNTSGSWKINIYNDRMVGGLEVIIFVIIVGIISTTMK